MLSKLIKSKKIAFLLIAVTILFLFSSTFIFADGCDDAYDRCMSFNFGYPDPIWYAYCAAGYAYCEIFVE